MKPKLDGFSKGYATALRIHLDQPAGGGLHQALALGHRSVLLGMETLQLARIHEGAFASLSPAAKRAANFRKRADTFFATANAPIEETHDAAQQTRGDLFRLEKHLGRRNKTLASKERQLRAGILLRRTMKAHLVESGRHHSKCLAESIQLQKLLRQLTHQALTAQEDDRIRLSHELQDEIAQTLLGINVRLLELKQRNGHNAKGLKNGIASAQQLVLKSAKSVRQFARKLAPHHFLERAPSRSPLP